LKIKKIKNIICETLKILKGVIYMSQKQQEANWFNSLLESCEKYGISKEIIHHFQLVERKIKNEQSNI